MEIESLIPVGAKIKVNKSKIKDFIPNKILDDLPQIINGEVIDYKMTDGMGIGYVLLTEKNKKIWIFTSELNDQTKIEYKIGTKENTSNRKTEEMKSNKHKTTYHINGNRNIKTLVNPINVFTWLIYTLKDTF